MLPMPKFTIQEVCKKKKQLSAKAKDSYYIYCEVCINVFPYSSISNDEFKFINSDLNVNANLYNIYEQCSIFKV